MKIIIHHKDAKAQRKNFDGVPATDSLAHDFLYKNIAPLCLCGAIFFGAF